MIYKLVRLNTRISPSNAWANTHGKVLIKDGEFAATTSFSWLFRGDPHRTFRDEQGTLVQLSEAVNQNLLEREPRFAGPDPPKP
jgi:hypothetical protein